MKTKIKEIESHIQMLRNRWVELRCDENTYTMTKEDFKKGCAVGQKLSIEHEIRFLESLLQ